MSLSGPAEWMSTNGVVAADAAGTATRAATRMAALVPAICRNDCLRDPVNLTPTSANCLSYGFVAR